MLDLLTFIAPESAGGEAAAESAGLPQLDASTFASQIFWLAVTFALLYAILAGVFLPRLAAILEERRDRIADDLDEAERLRGEAETAGKELEAALADARAKAHAIVEKQRDKMNREIAEETEAAEAEIAKKQSDAEARIRETKTEAMAKVREVASEATVSIVEKLIDKTPSDKDVQAAIDAAPGRS